VRRFVAGLCGPPAPKLCALAAQLVPRRGEVPVRAFDAKRTCCFGGTKGGRADARRADWSANGAFRRGRKRCDRGAPIRALLKQAMASGSSAFRPRVDIATLSLAASVCADLAAALRNRHELADSRGRRKSARAAFRKPGWPLKKGGFGMERPRSQWQAWKLSFARPWTSS